ncbi:ImmA/IrrE family metallo-endopeptidase [Paenibacillus ginsengarvi]|uniref:ImmA/IrrE family metallo-endopeptidase n=1 Tax=Paenibacillus ginsengarvi TaxID=400777 RepID=A0A3B0CNS9_9BACL|nr:ImmA/IrrE family metallo-endopeptidase [Paenibacillus ginsengarvi]RKN85889.1 ImmA/IrrE family metallo-endopeptidase [Paenibacillus ginsengarvi]
MYAYQSTPLEQSIEQLYRALSVREPHQLDAEAIAEGLGIWLHYAPYTSRAIDRAGLQSIVLDNRLSRQEQWQDFGHELCHLLHHAGNQLTMGESFIRFQETKAGNFAYLFCIPTFMLLAAELPRLESEAIAAISSLFGVTPEFAKERLRRHHRQVTSNRIAEQLTAYFHAEQLVKRKEGIDYIIQTRRSKMLFCRERGVLGYMGDRDDSE